MNDAFVLVTLIDITQTNSLRGETFERNQQRNFETVLQVLSLRTQPVQLEGPIKIENINLKENSDMTEFFGNFYKDQQGLHTVWGLKFASESSDIYSIDQLYKDFDQVPVITALNETAKFLLPIFHSYGSLKNIHFFTYKELNIS
jgi:hypothetical protein